MYTFELQDPIFLPHTACEVRLSLNDRQAMVLFGENGIGKSTLLQRLASQMKSTEYVIVEQRTSDYFYDRKLGVLKNIFLELKLPEFNSSTFLLLWKVFGLEEKEERLLSHLSGGESQALKLVLGLCKDAAVYFLDEPSQFLDPVKKKILYGQLELFRSQGKKLLVVEHQKDHLPKGWKAQELVMIDGILKSGSEWTI
jgi:ABC-type Mn2+/Zn2+ transport system ATPase subunit